MDKDTHSRDTYSIEIDMDGELIEMDIPRALYIALDPTLKHRKEILSISPMERMNSSKAINAIENACRDVRYADINYVMVASDETRYQRFLNDPDIPITVVVAETMGLPDMKIFQMANQARDKNIPFFIYTSKPEMYGEMKNNSSGILKKPGDLNLLTQIVLQHIQKT